MLPSFPSNVSRVLLATVSCFKWAQHTPDWQRATNHMHSVLTRCQFLSAACMALVYIALAASYRTNNRREDEFRNDPTQVVSIYWTISDEKLQTYENCECTCPRFWTQTNTRTHTHTHTHTNTHTHTHTHIPMETEQFLAHFWIPAHF